MVKLKKSSNPRESKPKIGSVRIIGGVWRGKKLPVLECDGLRPTTDRVKETLFNWLMTDIIGARCLDCFAGSGSLGFEAVSRQAKSVVMLENDPVVFKQLQANLQHFSGAWVDVIKTNSLDWLSQSGDPFDVVFVDPPFHRNLLDDTLQKLEQNGWLADTAWIYVESESRSDAPNAPDTWTLHREKQAGHVMSRLYYRHVR